MLSSEEIMAQSRSAYAQSGAVWRKNAERNGELFKKLGRSHKELAFSGAGKTCLCVGMGPSTEEHIEIIKKYQNNPALEIFCNDKMTGMLLKNGVKPKYVNIADAFVDYDRWMKPYINETKDITLISNVTANPEWSHNWQGPVYFYVNKDNIDTHKEYAGVSGCQDIIAAGSNVGNSICIFGCSVLGYSEYLLIGYDFAWRYDQNYYAFADEAECGTNKRGWMRHIMMIGIDGSPIQTSSNLRFSAQWLCDYYTKELSAFGIKMWNCSGSGMLEGVPQANFEKKMKNIKQIMIPENQKQAIFNGIMKHKIVTAEGGESELQKTINNNMVATVVVNYITTEQNQWLQSL